MRSNTLLVLPSAAYAGCFGQHAPERNRHRFEPLHPAFVKAVQAVIESGEFDVHALGEKPPNEQEIHDEYRALSSPSLPEPRK